MSQSNRVTFPPFRTWTWTFKLFIVSILSGSRDGEIFRSIRGFSDEEFLFSFCWVWVIAAAFLYGWTEQRWPRRKAEK